MSAPAVAIDDLLWTVTRFSDVLRVDRRVVAQALETAPSQTRGARQVWHVREGMPAIYRRVFGISEHEIDLDRLPPKDRLDYIRSQRELLKLQRETREQLSAAEVERAIGEAFKVLGQSLSTLPDDLEQECGIPAPALSVLHRRIDAARESLYQSLVKLFECEQE
ncbi:MAG: DUF1441 family protein [Gammaproteobacteria bacterium]|nr:DUF1441 family protein [Gammaproteobacteria bacterium]